jgi:hypothetical protein
LNVYVEIVKYGHTTEQLEFRKLVDRNEFAFVSDSVALGLLFVGLDAVQRTGDHLATRTSVLALGLRADLALSKSEKFQRSTKRCFKDVSREFQDVFKII